LAGLTDDQTSTCIQTMMEDTVKDRLKQYTEEALKYGVSVTLDTIN